MTKQSNKRKFLATTLTATMVAAAVAPVAGAAAADTQTFPDVPADHPYAGVIEAMVGAGVIKGQPDGNFNVHGNMTRAEAAIIVANLLDLPVAPATNTTDFEDVKSNAWYTGAINSLVAEGIVAGKTAISFAPNADITRAELSQLLVVAYGLEDKNVDNVELPFTDVKEDVWYTDAIKILYSEGLIKGIDTAQTKFAPNDNMKRGDFAWLSANVDYVHGDKLPKPEAAAQSVKAVDSTTLTVTGSNLKALTAEDITVENNTVKSVVASEDGKTATIILDKKLVVDTETTVTVKDQDFKVTYTIVADKAEIVSATYDDDTKDQYIAFTLNGSKVTAQELIDAGYNVEFTGFAKKSGVKLNHLFTSGAVASTTGELATDLNGTTASASSFVTELVTAGVLSNGTTVLPTAGVEVFVQVKITKGTETIQSEVSPIKIQNVDLATESIKEYTLKNNTLNTDQNSTTLVTGETADLTDITIVNDGKEEVVLYNSKLVTVSTSNEAVVSVKDGVLKAETPGTATITISYGTQTKTVDMTVTNTKRALDKAVITEDGKVITTKTMIAGKNGEFIGKVYDQYGDPIATPVTAKVTNASSNNPVAELGANHDATEQTASPSADGKFTINIGPKNPGSVVVTFHDAAGNKLTNSQLRVNVTANADLASYKLVTLDSDADFILDSLSTDDNKGAVVAKGLTSESVDLGVQTLTVPAGANNGTSTDVTIIKSTETNTQTEGYTVKWAESVVDLVDPASVKVDATTNSIEFVTKPGKTGNVTLTFINNETNKQASVTYTVKAEGDNIKAATLKTIPAPTFGKTIDYKDVLTHTQSQNDPIISGITLTSTTAQPVRLNLGATGGTVADLYIDKNADGKFDAADGDVVVGKLELSLVGSFAKTSTNAVTGIKVETGDKGTIIYKVLDRNGNVQASTDVKVDF